MIGFVLSELGDSLPGVGMPSARANRVNTYKIQQTAGKWKRADRADLDRIDPAQGGK